MGAGKDVISQVTLIITTFKFFIFDNLVYQGQIYVLESPCISNSFCLTLFSIQLALHIPRFCIHGFSQLSTENIREKKSTKFQKAKLELARCWQLFI